MNVRGLRTRWLGGGLLFLLTLSMLSAIGWRSLHERDSYAGRWGLEERELRASYAVADANAGRRWPAYNTLNRSQAEAMAMKAALPRESLRRDFERSLGRPWTVYVPAAARNKAFADLPDDVPVLVVDDPAEESILLGMRKNGTSIPRR